MSSCWPHLAVANVQASEPRQRQLVALHTQHVGQPEEKAPEVRKKTNENRSRKSGCHLSLLFLQWPEAFERVSSEKSSDMSLASVDSAAGVSKGRENREGSLERGEEKGRRVGEEGKLIVKKLMKPGMAAMPVLACLF